MLLLSTSYMPPIEYFALLYLYREGSISLEAHEHYVKQSYRNRCDVLAAGGLQSLTIPIERPSGSKTMIRDVRLSAHSDWRHLHTQALKTNYGASPFFEHYWDDLRPHYEYHYKYLWDLNLEMLHTLCVLLDIEVGFVETADFVPLEDHGCDDWRYRLHPRMRLTEAEDPFFTPSYYQPFVVNKHFVGGLSVLDLLMNMGPESLLILDRMASNYAGRIG